MQSTALSENMKTSFMYRLWFVERDITSQIGSVRPNPVCGRINTDLGVSDESMRRVSLCILSQKYM